MLKTINPEHPVISAMHVAIMTEYGCSLKDITGFVPDNVPKFMAVLITRHFYQYWGSAVSEAYKVNSLYIPKIIEKSMVMYAMCENFREKLHRILNFIEHYEDLESVA